MNSSENSGAVLRRNIELFSILGTERTLASLLFIRFIDAVIIFNIKTPGSITREHPCTLREPTFYSYGNEGWCRKGEGV